MTAVCFDLDGTLYDDRVYVKAGFRSAAAYLRSEYGIETFGEMVWEYGVERKFHTVFDQIIDTYDLPASELDQLMSAYHDCQLDIQPYPEVECLLAELPERCRTAVITGGKHGDEKLTRLGLAGAFDTVYVTPDNGTTKRDADPFEAVLDELEIDPAAAIYIGDNPELDFYWPNQLGMTTVWVRRRETIFTAPESTEARPQYVVPDLSLLPAIVDTLCC